MINFKRNFKETSTRKKEKIKTKKKIASFPKMASQNKIRDTRGRIVLGTIAQLNDKRFCFVCTQCDGEFLSIPSYEKHINLVHQKQTIADALQPTMATVNIRYGEFSTAATQQPTETIILSDTEDGDDDDICLISSDDESENDDDRTALAVFHMQNTLKQEPIFEITKDDSANVQFTVQKVVKREPNELPQMRNNELAKKIKLECQRPLSSSTSNGNKPMASVKMETDDFDFEWSGSDIDLSAATSFDFSDESKSGEENGKENGEQNVEEENEHDTTIKADDNGLKCSWCPHTFGKIFDLNQHLVTCEGWLKQFVICDHCPRKMFKWNVTKGMHMNKIHSNPNRPFNCQSCTRSFFTFLQLCQHRKHMHSEKAVIECHFCKDKRFLSWYERNQHVLKKHQFGEYECFKYDCGYTCKTADQLNQHHKKIHSDQMPVKL